jgi:hypothetical protein
VYVYADHVGPVLNLLVFLIGIADHAGPLVQYFLFTKNQSRSVCNWYCWSGRAFRDAQDRVTKGKKKAKRHTQAQNKSRCKSKVFYGPFLPIWYYINLSIWYLDAVCSAATGVLFVWIPCGISYVKTSQWHTWHQEGWCKWIIMLNLVSAHIIHLILENDFYLYSHKWLYFAGFQTSCRCFHRICKVCPGDAVRVHS